MTKTFEEYLHMCTNRYAQYEKKGICTCTFAFNLNITSKKIRRTFCYSLSQFVLFHKFQIIRSVWQLSLNYFLRWRFVNIEIVERVLNENRIHMKKYRYIRVWWFVFPCKVIFLQNVSWKLLEPYIPGRLSWSCLLRCWLLFVTSPDLRACSWSSSHKRSIHHQEFLL